MINSIVITTQTLLEQNTPVKIQVGWFDDSGFLTNITNYFGTYLQMNVVSGSATIRKLTTGLILQSDGLQDVTIKCVYSKSNVAVTTFINLHIIPKQMWPIEEDIFKLITANLPTNVYSQVRDSSTVAETTATARLFDAAYISSIYPSISILFNILYPPLTSDSRWESTLTQYQNWGDSVHYRQLLQLMNSIQFYSCNVYDLSYLISEYLYCRFGQSCYVYIEQAKDGKEILYWQLNESFLSETTTLAATSTYAKHVKIFVQSENHLHAILNELYSFCRRIFPPDVEFTIGFVDNFNKFGITYYISDTYNGDPRLYTRFALKYSQSAVYSAKAIINPRNPLFMTAFYITPVTNSVFAEFSTPFNLEGVVEYTIGLKKYYENVTRSCSFVSSDSAVLQLNGSLATPLDPGTVSVTAHLEWLPSQPMYTFIANYTVSGTIWKLDTSELNNTTTLG